MRRPVVTLSGDDGPSWDPSGESRQAFGQQVNGVASPRAPRIDGQDIQVMYQVALSQWIPLPSYLPQMQFMLARPATDVLSAVYHPYGGGSISLSPTEIADLWSSGGDTTLLPDNPAGKLVSPTDPIIKAQPGLNVTLQDYDAHGNPSGSTPVSVFYSVWVGYVFDARWTDTGTYDPSAPIFPMPGSITAVPLNWMTP